MICRRQQRFANAPTWQCPLHALLCFGAKLFEHDGAPEHKASSMKRWFEKVGVEEQNCFKRYRRWMIDWWFKLMMKAVSEPLGHPSTPIELQTTRRPLVKAWTMVIWDVWWVERASQEQRQLSELYSDRRSERQVGARWWMDSHVRRSLLRQVDWRTCLKHCGTIL